MAGVVETKEALIGVNELALYLISRFKDGLGLDDALDLFAKLASDAQFKEVFSKAIEGIGNVPGEVKDLDLYEGMELAELQIRYVPKYVEAFK